jgi:hypothetical protein
MTWWRRTRRQLPFVWAIGFVLGLGGCAEPKHWTKPESTADDFARDSQACEREATRVYGRSAGFHPVASFSPSGVYANVSTEAYRDCLERRGYQRVEGGPWIGARD